MRFFETESLERIGFDFYCDIANNIVMARKEMGLTQKELAKQASIKESRLSGIEEVKIRLDLDDLEKMSKALNRTVDWLIDAELDCRGEECLYLVWPESMTDFKLYKRATSKRMAFLVYDKMFKDSHIAYNSNRERFFIKLVGVPVTQKELQNRFKKRTVEDLPLEPDKEDEQ